MNYENASKRFNITSHLKTIENLDWLQMLEQNTKEYQLAEKISISKKELRRRDVEYLQQKYEETFQMFKPLIENLVEKGQWKEEGLSIFQL